MFFDTVKATFTFQGQQ